MTREKAKEAIKEVYGNTEYTDRIIQALEQEPCEDAISRQAVIDGIKRYFHDEYYQRTSIQECRDCLIEDVIKDMPTVNPQEPKTGHWEIIPCGNNHGEYRPPKYMCSECGWEIDFCRGLQQDTGHRLFCEHCGAKMTK